MADPIEYEVAREHRGDQITDDGIVQKDFKRGDTRLADPAIVKHLVGTVLIDPTAVKAEPDLENKAEGNAPSTRRTRKPA